jgi:hypothetical protein
MNGYTLLRLVHGYWRWMVLVCGVVVLLRAFAALRNRRAWTASDDRASRIFVAVVDVQVFLGLTLYFVFSPFWSAVRESFRFAMKDPTSRSFGMEHETAMLLAFIAVHVGRVRARRISTAVGKHRALLASTLVFFALVAWAIPWPWRMMGRPLFRTSW